jgi:hypothetical protein
MMLIIFIKLFWYLGVPFSTPALSMGFRHLLVLKRSTRAGALCASSAAHRDTHTHTSTTHDSFCPRGSALDATPLRAGTLTPPSLSAAPHPRHPRTRTRECRWGASALGSPALRADGGRVVHACMGMAVTKATSASATTAAKAARMAIAFVAVRNSAKKR